MVLYSDISNFTFWSVDILKCKIFLIGFLNGLLDNFKQKKFYISKCKFFLHFTATQKFFHYNDCKWSDPYMEMFRSLCRHISVNKKLLWIVVVNSSFENVVIQTFFPYYSEWFWKVLYTFPFIFWIIYFKVMIWFSH